MSTIYPKLISLTLCSKCFILSYAESMHLSCPLCGKMKPPGSKDTQLKNLSYRITEKDSVVVKDFHKQGKLVLKDMINLKELTAEQLLYVKLHSQ